MDKETEVKVSEIETLKKIKKTLEEEISKLQVTYNNLEAQAHSKGIKEDQDLKLKEAEIMTKYAVEERLLESKRIEIEGRIDVNEILQNKLNDREGEIEKREQKLIDLEGKIEDLNKQRTNFEDYKISIITQLDQAQETINRAKETFATIEAEKITLSGREAKVKRSEKIWNDEIGKLEEAKRNFQAEKENLIGLKKTKKEIEDDKN